MIFSPEARRIIREINSTFRMERTVERVAYMDGDPDIDDKRRNAMRIQLGELQSKKENLFAQLLKETEYEP